MSKILGIVVFFLASTTLFAQEMVTATIGRGEYKLTLTEELRFGSVEEEDHYLWPSLQTQILPAPNGGMYIIDHDGSQILLFDEQGQFVKCAARKGEGPGELQYMNAVSRTATGMIYVMDTPSPGNGIKIKRFNADMTFRDEISTTGMKLRPDALFVSHDEKYMGGLFVSFDPETRGLSVKNGVLRLADRAVVNLFNEDKAPLGTSRIKDQNQWVDILAEGYKQKRRAGLTAMGPDGTIYSGNVNQYVISQWKPENPKPSRVVTVNYKPKPFTEQDVADYIDFQYLNMDENSKRTISRATMVKGLEKAGLPTHPPLLGIIPLEDKGFLAVRKAHLTTRKNEADVFSKEGKFLCKLEMPDAAMCTQLSHSWTPLTRMVFHQGKAYAMITDENDSIIAVRYHYSLQKL